MSHHRDAPAIVQFQFDGTSAGDDPGNALPGDPSGAVHLASQAEGRHLLYGIVEAVAHQGVAQMLFLESDEVCETSCKDRGGKYQGQKGVTLPRA